MARVCVTGGAGFIGSTLVEQLLMEGHNVDVIDNLSTGSLANLEEVRKLGERNLTFQRIDVTSGTFRTYMRIKRPTTVFHLASNTNKDIAKTKPAKDAEINVLGSINVFSACIENHVEKIVYATSGADLYGVFSEPISEGAVRRPVSTSGVSKNSAYEYLYSLCRGTNTKFTALALSDVYGPKQNEQQIVPDLISHIGARERPAILGDGTSKRDFIYVEDVVNAISKAQTLGDGLLINISTAKETSVQQLYELVANMYQFKEPPKYKREVSSELDYTVLDNSRAAIHLDWKPTKTLEDGIKQLLGWYRVKSYR